MVADLKANKKDVASYVIKKVYPDGIKEEKVFLGTSENFKDTILIEYETDSKSKKIGIKNLIDKECSIKNAYLNPCKFIKQLKDSLNYADEIDCKVNDEYNDKKFGMRITTNLKKRFWFNEYIVIITIEFQKKLISS